MIIIAMVMMPSSVMAEHDPFKFENWADQMTYDSSHESTSSYSSSGISNWPDPYDSVESTDPLRPSSWGCTSLGQDLGNC